MSLGHNALGRQGAGRHTKRFAFTNGSLVLVKWDDGMVYFAKIKRIDEKREKCTVVFDDKSQDEADFSQIHSVDETTTDIICIKCKKDNSDSPNEIVLCDMCGIGFHQKCHNPPIPASALQLDIPWNCSYCQRGTKCPFLTESLDVLQNLLSDNEATTGEEDEGGTESEYYDDTAKGEPSTRLRGSTRKRKGKRSYENSTRQERKSLRLNIATLESNLVTTERRSMGDNSERKPTPNNLTLKPKTLQDDSGPRSLESGLHRKRKKHHAASHQKRLKRSSVESRTVSVTRIDTPIYENGSVNFFPPVSPDNAKRSTLSPVFSSPEPNFIIEESHTSDSAKKDSSISRSVSPVIKSPVKVKHRQFRVSLSLPDEMEKRPQEKSLLSCGSANPSWDDICSPERSPSIEKDSCFASPNSTPSSEAKKPKVEHAPFVASPLPTTSVKQLELSQVKKQCQIKKQSQMDQTKKQPKLSQVKRQPKLDQAKKQSQIAKRQSQIDQAKKHLEIIQAKKVAKVSSSKPKDTGRTDKPTGRILSSPPGFEGSVANGYSPTLQTADIPRDTTEPVPKSPPTMKETGTTKGPLPANSGVDASIKSTKLLSKSLDSSPTSDFSVDNSLPASSKNGGDVGMTAVQMKSARSSEQSPDSITNLSTDITTIVSAVCSDYLSSSKMDVGVTGKPRSDTARTNPVVIGSIKVPHSQPSQDFKKETAAPTTLESSHTSKQIKSESGISLSPTDKELTSGIENSVTAATGVITTASSTQSPTVAPVVLTPIELRDEIVNSPNQPAETTQAKLAESTLKLDRCSSVSSTEPPQPTKQRPSVLIAKEKHCDIPPGKGSTSNSPEPSSSTAAAPTPAAPTPAAPTPAAPTPAAPTPAAPTPAAPTPAAPTPAAPTPAAPTPVITNTPPPRAHKESLPKKAFSDPVEGETKVRKPSIPTRTSPKATSDPVEGETRVRKLSIPTRTSPTTTTTKICTPPRPLTTEPPTKPFKEPVEKCKKATQVEAANESHTSACHTPEPDDVIITSVERSSNRATPNSAHSPPQQELGPKEVTSTTELQTAKTSSQLSQAAHSAVPASQFLPLHSAESSSMGGVYYHVPAPAHLEKHVHAKPHVVRQLAKDSCTGPSTTAPVNSAITVPRTQHITSAPVGEYYGGNAAVVHHPSGTPVYFRHHSEGVAKAAGTHPSSVTATTKPYAIVNAIPTQSVDVGYRSIALPQKVGVIEGGDEVSGKQHVMCVVSSTGVTQLAIPQSACVLSSTSVNSSTPPPTLRPPPPYPAHSQIASTSDADVQSIQKKIGDAFNQSSEVMLVSAFEEAWSKFQANEKVYEARKEKEKDLLSAPEPDTAASSHTLVHQMSTKPRLIAPKPSPEPVQQLPPTSIPVGGQLYHMGGSSPPQQQQLVLQPDYATVYAIPAPHASKHQVHVTGLYYPAVETSTQSDVRGHLAPRPVPVSKSVPPQHRVVQERTQGRGQIPARTQALPSRTITTSSSRRQPQTGKSPGQKSAKCCARCGKGATYLCSGCHMEWYCGRDCQLKSWATHSDQCKA